MTTTTLPSKAALLTASRCLSVYAGVASLWAGTGVSVLQGVTDGAFMVLYTGALVCTQVRSHSAMSLPPGNHYIACSNRDPLLLPHPPAHTNNNNN